MVAVFREDGDLLLLARDGRVHAFMHDNFKNDEVISESFDELLAQLITERTRRCGG